MRLGFGLFLGITIQLGCASNMEQFSNKVSIEGAEEQNVTSVPALAYTTRMSFSSGKDGGEIESSICLNQAIKSSDSVLVFMDSGFDLTESKFCDSWFMQVFLKEGYNPLAINLPAQGKSTGAGDFYGPGDLAAVSNLIEKVSNEKKMVIVGTWGYSKASIIASFYAKQNKTVKWLILGAGIYDLEVFHKGLVAGEMKKELDQLYLSHTEEFYEMRSIAWDIENLPRNVYIYHSIHDPLVPESQAVAFRDGLAAKEYNVNYIGVQENTHEIEPKKHQKILGKVLELIKKRD